MINSRAAVVLARYQFPEFSETDPERHVQNSNAPARRVLLRVERINSPAR